MPGAAMLLGALLLCWYPLRGARLQKAQTDTLALHERKHAQLVQK